MWPTLVQTATKWSAGYTLSELVLTKADNVSETHGVLEGAIKPKPLRIRTTTKAIVSTQEEMGPNEKGSLRGCPR